MAQPLYGNCADSFAESEGWIYFAAGSEGLLRIPCAGGTAEPVDALAGYLAIPGDGWIYWQRGSTGLWRKNLESGELQQLDTEAGYLVVDYACEWVYYQRGNGGPLYRVPCNGSPSEAVELDPNGGYMAVDDRNVYFQAGSHGLYRMPCTGKPGDAVRIDENAGHLVLYDGTIYFHAGTKGLYHMPCTGGSGDAKRLDPNCGYLAVPGDDYVYFQAGGKGLYRVRRDGTADAVPLDANCGYLIVPGDGWIYFQGNPHDDALFRTVQPADCPMPSGPSMKVQDHYTVDTVFNASDKYAEVKALLDEAYLSTSDTWYVNFTSGASSGAYPDAVAGRINDDLALYVGSLAKQPKHRLGTIVMDFPNRVPDLISGIISYNSGPSPVPLTSWMSTLPDGTLLSDLTIPGTHDSCTFNASNISCCQDLDLPAQLAAGIRFIDIRCRHYYDKFELHHGQEYLKLQFDYVLESCRDFLQKTPGAGDETIIVSVKEEYDPEGNTATFAERFQEYVNAYSDLLWYRKNAVPQLGSVRGQLVLFRRFYIQDTAACATSGIDVSLWPDDTTFTRP